MFRRHGHKLTWVFLVCDLGVTAFCWIAAYVVRYALFESPRGVPSFASCLAALPFVVLLAGFSYRICGLYEIHRLQRLPSELVTLLRAGGLLFLLTITTAFYRRDPYESRFALGIFFALNIVLLVVVRRVIWRGLRWLRHRGFNHGRAVIVGTGRTARKVAATLDEHDWTGLEVMGHIYSGAAAAPDDLAVIGTIDDLGHIVENQGIDFVFVALPLSQEKELRRVYAMLGDVPVDVQWVPDIPNLSGMNLRTNTLNGMAFVGLRESPHYGLPHVLKRATDLIGGLAATVVFAPVMALIVVLIKLTSRGPVFFRQERAGLGGRPFQMMKFRTMRVDAEHTSGPVWARRNDDRCTPIGRFLRGTSLDELPQLFNVLRGDMSLVGPRPERPFFIDRFRKTVPHYMLRHAVKAGMTGWAQVHGWRGDTSLRKRVQYDLYYISHWSLGLDLRILWLTLRHGFGNKNAH